jgi:hypothetical protein
VSLAPVADGLEHDEGDREGCGGGDLAGARLDEVGAGEHRQPRRAADVVVGDEFAGLHDDLESGARAVRASAGCLDRDDLVEDLR